MEKTDKHEELWREFLQTYGGKIEGEKIVDWKKNVGVGWYMHRLISKQFKSLGFKPDTKKEIDVLLETDKNVWIMEIKPELNFEAIGQVYVYQYLMQQDVKSRILKKKEPSVYRVKIGADRVWEIDAGKEIHLAILCEEVKEFLKDFCDDKNIEVFCDRIRKIG